MSGEDTGATMDMEKAPAFQFYARDWMSDAKIKLLSLEAQGAYVRLLSVQWIEGELPLNPISIATVTDINPRSMRKLWPQLEQFFPTVNGGTARANKRLDKQRKALIEHRLAKSAGGKKGAEMRWDSHNTPNGSPNGSPNSSPNGIATDLPMRNDSSAVASAFATAEQQQQLLFGPTSSTPGEAGASPDESDLGNGTGGQQPGAGADTAGAGLGNSPGGDPGPGAGGGEDVGLNGGDGGAGAGGEKPKTPKKPKGAPKPPDEFDLAAVEVLRVGWPEIGPDVNRKVVLKKLAAVLRRRENKISAAELTGILRWGYDVWRPQGYMSSPGAIGDKKPTDDQPRWGKLKYGMSINGISDPATYVPGSFEGRDGKAVRISGSCGTNQIAREAKERERLAQIGKQRNAKDPEIQRAVEEYKARRAAEAAKSDGTSQQPPKAA